MQSLTTRLDGLVLIAPTVHRDDRGFFLESFRENELTAMGVDEHWVQDNHSRSTRGVLRGLHFSIGAGQAKLVRCARGSILDVAVDLRRGSPTYGRWEAVVLDDELHHSLFIPVGFAHGFCVTSDVADVVYKCSAYYNGDVERGIAFDDPDVCIEWPDPPWIVSERDRTAPRLREVEDSLPFVYETPPAT
jgi:dTDP-4-dehydrorhamnose 3,5-epimerase